MISVIVPIYNAEKYILRCVQSIQQQSYNEYEIILINDGSTDSSREICYDLAQKYSFIRVLEQSNQGVSAARNYGIENANGQYIFFVDADDWIKPDTLQKMIDMIQEKDFDMVICDYEECIEDFINTDGREINIKVVKKNYYKDTFLTQYLLVGNTRCWGILFKRSLIAKYKFRVEYTIGEDLLFLLDILPELNQIGFLSYKGYCYYINKDGAMCTEFKREYMDQIYCWLEAKRILIKSYPYTIDRIESIIMVSTMLVAGKMAMLSNKNRKSYQSHILDMQKNIRNGQNNKTAYRMLDLQYKIKTFLFAMSPSVYFVLYHIWK